MIFLVISRIVSVVPKIFVVITIIFFITRLGPGDPAQVILGDYASEESLNAVREQLGLNRPILEQYWDFLVGLVHLDLGKSFINNQPVVDQLKRAIPYSVELTLFGVLFGVLVGIPLGIAAAAKKTNFQTISVESSRSLEFHSLPLCHQRFF